MPESLLVSDFDFDLPDELIAQEPPPVRGQSRLLVVERGARTLHHARFDQLGDYLQRGDLLVLNDTRVFPARLLGRREPSGGAVECMLTRQLEPSLWDALMHPGQKLKPGARVIFERDRVTVRGEIVARHVHGRRTVRLWSDSGASVADLVDRIGHIPLPPYIKREDCALDRDRYQTVYASHRGSVAAPTAGLHFTPALLAALVELGVEHTAITLHVGYGTFKPVRVERVEDHAVEAETFTVSEEAAAALARARRERRRIVAVGTTTARALESLAVGEDGSVEAAARETNLFIRPGHEFRLVSGLVTNFHLPRSSLLMLVSAFAGRDTVLGAYRDAVMRRYRFYSYGDAMVVI